MTEAIIIAMTFGIGTLMGSFGAVLVQSFKDGDCSYISRRSYCTHTKKPLKWYHLIPIISYIIQGGKSKFSGKPIGIHYLLSELFCGALFTIPYIYSLYNPINFYEITLLYGLLFAGFLISYFDARYQEIPDAFTIIFGLFAFLLGRASGLSFLQQLFAGGIFAGFFLLQYVVSKGKWIGAGDILLGLALGLLLGWQKVLVALLLSYLLGSVISLGIIFRNHLRKIENNYIAFGPFLILGSIISYFFGTKLIQIYFNLTLIPLP